VNGKTVPTRDDLIALCVRGSVPQEQWCNRDSASAQRQLGECLALLAAGCDFSVSPTIGGSPDNGRTWWVTVYFHGFNYFEVGEESSEDFFVPSAERLADAAGMDWY
jgi:hypothetical protein